MRRRDVLLAGLCLAGSGFFGTRSISAATLPSPAASTAKIIRHLRFTLTLENPTDSTLTNQRVWVYMPAAETATQRLASVEVGMPHRLQTDQVGNTIVEISLERLAPYATQVVIFSSKVMMSAVPIPQPLAQHDLWLAEEPYIEISDTGINALAEKLRRPAEMETARAIYDWIRSNLNYAGYIADDLGARYALRERSGDCTEYAYLAVALARANRIPARVVGGYVTDRDFAPRAQEYHNWAELYLNGAWRLLDSQKETFLGMTERYVTFRILSSRVANPLGNAHRFKIEGEMIARLG